MPETYTQMRPNSSHGPKLRERQRTVGASTVGEQGVYYSAPATYYAIADNVAFAANTQVMSLVNGSGSGVVVKLSKLFLIDTILEDAAGTRIRFDVKQATAHSGGTELTPVAADSTNAALPSQVTLMTGATSVSEGSKLFPLTLANDEIGYTQGFMNTHLLSGLNWMPEGIEQQEFAMREGEGLAIKQITSSVVGTYSWLIVFTVAAT